MTSTISESTRRDWLDEHDSIYDTFMRIADTAEKMRDEGLSERQLRKVELDLEYIDRLSFLYDLRIVARTVGVVLRRPERPSRSSHVPAPGRSRSPCRTSGRSPP